MSVRKLIEGLAPVAAWIAFSMIIDYAGRKEIEVVRSLTATEVTELVVEKASAFIGPYLAALACVSGSPKCGDLESEVREFRKMVATAKCRSAENVEKCVEEVMSADLRDVIRMAREMGLIEPPPSLLFVGPPGVGKSEAVREAAKRIAERYGLEFVDLAEATSAIMANLLNPSTRRRYFVFVDLRLTSVEPADLMGIPRRVEAHGRTISEYIPFAWVDILSTGPGMLFLDELTNVRREDVLAAAYQLLLDRKSGFKHFDPGVVIVAAGNPPSWSSIARKLPVPLHTRVEVFNVVKPTIYEWYLYMVRRYGDRWCKFVYTFISVLGDENWCPSAHGRATALGPDEQVATPRSWTRLAVQLYRMFLAEASEKGVTPDDIVRNALMKAAVRGGCNAVRSMLPGEAGYDELKTSKMICEIVAGTVGTEMAQEMSMFALIPPIPAKLVLENPDRLPELVELDCLAIAYVLGESIPSEAERRIREVFGELPRMESVPPHLKSLARHAARVDEYAVKYVLRILLVELSNVIEEWCEKGKDELMKHVDTIARIIDNVLKIMEEKGGGIKPQDIVLLATMLLPICRRRWIDVKQELLKRSRRMMELIDKLAEALVPR